MLLFCFLLLFLQAKKTINLLEKKRKHLILQTYFHPLLSSALLARLLVVFAELAATASAICSTQVRKGSRIRNTWVRHFYPCGMGSYEISRKKEEGRGFAYPKTWSFSNWESTASTMGTIMAVVAVLDIHMDRNMVGIMKPNISRRGEVPIVKRAFKATRRCKFDCSTAMATITPEMNIMFVSFKYSRPTSSVVIIPTEKFH